ncbi:MAG: exodeoxyribonuclease VII large subunit [Deltaproteobacteria bacterium]|nr:exodeoxyribonuclease VII large subunit [Deltaproteobacteria bacterium]
MTDAGVIVLPVRPKAMTVGELTRHVKTKLEADYAQVWVEGEISQLKIAASGHAYFDLRDPMVEARISCCFFKGPYAKTRLSLREGMKLLIRGRVSLYPPRGSFQFIVETAMVSGEGTAAAALEALKRKLEAEGLFASEKKRKIPRFPRIVGVVTAETGAAFADICRVLRYRWPTHVVLANTLVQGADAPAQITAAIASIQRVSALDVLIVGRGGGASEDLAAFNDERVVRAIAACRVPVISAVGHEVDHTLADLAADLRAATPSNAAELAVPELVGVRSELAQRTLRLRKSMSSVIDRQRVRLARLDKLLSAKSRMIETPRQRIDEALARMQRVVLTRLRRARVKFSVAGQRLESAHPRVRLAGHRAVLGNQAASLRPAMVRQLASSQRALEMQRTALAPAMQAALRARRVQLQTLAAKLHALSPLAILARGYAVALDEQGRAVIRADDVGPGDSLTIRLHEGSLDVLVKPRSVG